MTDFMHLDVWKVAMQLARVVYRFTSNFPRSERFGLSAQMRRAAVSIPSNIAEGNGRASTKDYARFVSMALGSNAELHTQLMLSNDLGFGEDASRDNALELCTRSGQMLTRLHQSLKRKIEAKP